MSILIKGMDMPKENEWITISIYGDGTVVKKIGYFRGMNDVFANSAVDVPTPHGDLIDREELFRLASKRLFPNIHIGQVRYIAYNILPTVIESEE